MNAIFMLLKRNSMEPVFVLPAHADWRADQDFHKVLSGVDLVLVNGEGTIHHNRPAGRLLLELGPYAHSSGVPVALINTGWQANDPQLVSLLGAFDLVTARDERSAERMRAAGANVRVVPDLSFWFARSQGFKPCEKNVARAGIGVTDNVDRFKALELDDIRSRVNGYLISIAYSRHDLLGWLRFLRSGLSLSADLHHPARFAKLLRLRHRLWMQRSSSFQGFVSSIQTLKLLISGRFHVCTLALSAGTPLAAQASNTDKIAALFDDVGLEKWRYERAFDYNHLCDSESYNWTDYEHRNLSNYCDNAVDSAEKLFSDLARLAGAYDI
jgi:polysaccharide pyruvyl transferase WcaK-like protein